MKKKGRKASENQNQENIKVRELVEIIKALKQRSSLYHCQTEQIIDNRSIVPSIRANKSNEHI